MSNKKFPKLAVLSLLGVLGLTACGSSAEGVKSLPGNYNDPVITIDDETEEIHNNIIKIIADQLHDGDLPSKTLDKVLYRYAQSVYGAYNKVALADGDTSVTLKEATKIARSNSASTEELEKLYKFIRAHKVYWTYNDKGEHINDDDADPSKWSKVEDDKTFIPCSSEIIRMTSRFDDIEKRIAENMFAKVSGSSYTSKHFFKEADYLKSLYEAGQSVKKYTEQAVKDVKPLIIDYTVEEDEVFTAGILHREFYQSNFGLDEDETAGTEKYQYIEKEIVPQIYSDLLVEQYLLDEESNAVKQSRARLINVIKIEKYSSFHINADLLVKQLVREIYSKAPTGDYLAYVDEANNPFREVFEKYEEISKGLKVYDPATVTPVTDETSAEYWNAEQIIYRIHESRSDAFKYAVKQGKAYYENTTYGDLVEDYDEFLSAESFEEIDTSLRNKFTSSGTVSPEEGFDQERISLSQVEAITKGWYVQKSGPSLDSNGTIKSNLFQLSVANNKLEAKDATDEILKWTSEHERTSGFLANTDRYTKASGTWEVREEKAKAENKYICSINGGYFLKFEGSYAGSEYTSDIVYDDGSAYYICQVIEAAKDVKLRNSESESSYANTRGQEFLNEVISEVTTKVAETGSYSSLSKEYWLKKMDIVYHDQSVYDYFKSNYPDLFE